eukprot:156833-Rhodomonas_salina.1
MEERERDTEKKTQREREKGGKEGMQRNRQRARAWREIDRHTHTDTDTAHGYTGRGIPDRRIPQITQDDLPLSSLGSRPRGTARMRWRRGGERGERKGCSETDREPCA